jgi:hypothetical protein
VIPGKILSQDARILCSKSDIIHSADNSKFRDGCSNASFRRLKKSSYDLLFFIWKKTKTNRNKRIISKFSTDDKHLIPEIRTYPEYNREPKRKPKDMI